MAGVESDSIPPVVSQVEDDYRNTGDRSFLSNAVSKVLRRFDNLTLTDSLTSHMTQHSCSTRVIHHHIVLAQALIKKAKRGMIF